MTSRPLSHPLVRDYLDELDAALRALTPEQARELREQITAHLDDALTAAAGDQDVAAVLRRLGRPAAIAAEAVVPARVTEPAEPGEPSAVEAPGAAISPGLTRAAEAGGLTTPRRRRRWHAPRIAWQASALIAVAVVGAGYLIAVESAPPLQQFLGQDWWYPVDADRSVATLEPTGETVMSAPIRSGQMQGMVMSITNTSDWTQTVLGPVPYMMTPGGVTDVQVAVSGYSLDIERGGLITNVPFTSPGSIPPHQIRELRVLWRTTVCQPDGGSMLVNGLTLRVRIGGVDRTENIKLGAYWTLAGKSPPPNASNLCI